MTRRVLPPLLAVAVFVVLAVGAGIWFLTQLDPVRRDAEPQLFTITSGEGVTAIAERLKSQGLVRNAFVFRAYLTLEGLARNLQAGEYQLAASNSTPQIAAALAEGRVVLNETIIQIPEGWSSAQIGQYLDADKHLFPLEAWTQAVSVTDSRVILPDQTFDFLLDKPMTAPLEGYLFPDTYRVRNTAQPADVMNKMLQNFGSKVDANLRAAFQGRGLSTFQAVTLASIIEREVKTDADRHRVADIFLKRLQIGMPLQADATLTYIIGKTSAELTNEDLALDSPYNTYKYPGLPPGPIGNPGLATLRAVANPQPNPYYYFLTLSSGETLYAATLEEHNQNKLRLRQTP